MPKQTVPMYLELFLVKKDFWVKVYLALKSVLQHLSASYRDSLVSYIIREKSSYDKTVCLTMLKVIIMLKLMILLFHHLFKNSQTRHPLRVFAKFIHKILKKLAFIKCGDLQGTSQLGIFSLELTTYCSYVVQFMRPI